MSDQVTSRRVILKVAGERQAIADALFIDTPDLDGDAYAPNAFPETVIPVGRNHDPSLGGDQPPFAVAKMRNRGDRYTTEIDFLDTFRGREEHATIRALDAAGVRQPVSIGFVTEATAPVPASLKDSARRYVTKGRFIEISFVTIGAIPGAELLSVKAHTPQAKPDPAVLAEALKMLERSQALLACLKERHGPIAWDAAGAAARWLTGGRVQEGPAIKWFDRDERPACAGYFKPGQDCVHLCRGMSEYQTIKTSMHEVSHWWHCWDPSETSAQADAEWLTQRYYQSLKARSA